MPKRMLIKELQNDESGRSEVYLIDGHYYIVSTITDARKRELDEEYPDFAFISRLCERLAPLVDDHMPSTGDETLVHEVAIWRGVILISEEAVARGYGEGSHERVTKRLLEGKFGMAN